MKGKNILVTAACVLGFGGIVANSAVGVATSRELNAKIDEIAAAAKDADQADKAELKQLIETTSANIKAAYEAADANLQASLNTALVLIDQTKADLKAELEAEMDAKDSAALNSVLGKIEALKNTLQTAITALGSDVAALQAFHATIPGQIADIEEAIADLEDANEDLADDVEAAFDALVDVANLLINTINRVGALETAVNALTARLNDEYLTSTEVTALMSSVNTAITTLAGYLRDGNGNIVSMQTVLAEIEALATSINDSDSDIGGIQAKLDAFNGQAAREAKAELVSKLWNDVVGSYQEMVNDAYDEVRHVYEDADKLNSTVPASVIAVRDALLDPAVLGPMQNSVMGAITMVILAQDVTSAQKVYDEFVGTHEGNINKLLFEKDKAQGLLALSQVTVTGTAFTMSTTAEEYFENRVLGISYVEADAGDTVEEMEEYYQGLQAEVAVAVEQAKGYASLLTALNVKAESLVALNVDINATNGRLTGSTELNTYAEDLTALADFTTYKTACENKVPAPQNTPGNGLISFADAPATEMVYELGDAASIAEYNQGIVDRAEVIVYCADVLDDMLQAQATAKAVLTTIQGANNATYEDVLNVLDTSIMTNLLANIAKAVSAADYATAITAAKGAEGATVATIKEAVRAYVDAQVANVKYEALVAQYIFDVKTAAMAADDTIDALTLISDATKTMLKNTYEDANVPTLDEVYAASNKGAAGQFTQYSDFAACLAAATADISAVVAIAQNDEAVLSAAATLVTNIEAAAAVMGTEAAAYADTMKEIAGIVKVDALYADAGDGTTAKTAIKGSEAADANLTAIATAAAADLAVLNTRGTRMVEIYKDYNEVVEAEDLYNAKLVSAVDAMTALFPIQNNNNAGDGDTILLAHATEINELVEDYAVVHGAASGNSVTVYAPTAQTTAEEAMTGLETMDAAFLSLAAGLDGEFTAFQGELEAIRVTMVQEYAVAEAATLEAEIAAYVGADGLAGAGTKVGDMNAKLEAYIADVTNGVSAEVAHSVELIMGELVSLIKEAQRSDDVVIIYTSAMNKVAAKLLGDPTMTLADLEIALA